MTGHLYLIPTVLSEDALHVIPAYVHEITAGLDFFIVENERTARRYLRKTGFNKSFDAVTLFSLNQHTTPEGISAIISALKNGADFGLMSEAGVPAVADPGAVIVSNAHKLGMQVIPLSGPSSIILALMASGLNGQQFSFLGYLPVEQKQRIQKIQDLEKRAVNGETQIFIETPYRNNALLKDILQACHPKTTLCIACNLTGIREMIKTKQIAEWRQLNPVIEKVPAVFLLGKS